MLVFVLNMHGEPLMPCSQRKARILLKQVKAKIVKYNPFTIQLLYGSSGYKQEVNIGVDTGAKHIGIAVTSKDKVLAKGEIELRNDISDNVSSRSMMRRSRRNHKTRYRPARWQNRKRKQGWLPPSVQAKLDATFMWIDKFCELVPNPKLHIEVGKFDVAKMINPDITGVDYQNGSTKGYYDVRYYVFARDNYTCQVCKKKNRILHTHHILFRHMGGTNRTDNLISVCTECHTSANHKQGGVLHDWMLKQKKVKQYKEATFMNIVRCRTYKKYPDARITYGSETTPRRKALELEKSHYNDAIVISGIGNINENHDGYFYIKQFRKKKRSLHEQTPRKMKNKNTTQKRNNKNVKFRNGTYLNDSIVFNKIICWVYGFAGGERSKECVLRDIDGKLIQDPKRSKGTLTVSSKDFKVLHHNNGWQYTMKKDIESTHQSMVGAFMLPSINRTGGEVYA